MALSEDQKAMLRLLAQREQGYDDLAALMGLSVDEVRAKVKDALAQLEAEGEPQPDVPPPAPPGPVAQKPELAEPASVPDAAEPQESEEELPPPPEPAPAEPLSPAKPTEPAATPPKTTRPASGPTKLSLPKDRGIQAAIGAGVLAVIAIVVLLIAGGSGGDSSEGSSASAGSGEGNAANVSENSELTEAVLKPVDGGDAEGRAIFGRVKKNVVLQVEATGLEPSPKGSAYSIWLYKSPKLALRIGAVQVTENGGIAVQLPIPTELLAYVASGAFNQIDIALTENAAYAAEVAKSKAEKRLPEHVGESVLRGQVTGPAIEQAAKDSGG
ncbi:MAG: hypothetical protein ABW065_06550 [Solirubrobacterales bacterium]